MKIGRIGESAITINRIRKMRAAITLCVAVLGVALATAAQAPIISLSPGDTINTIAGTGIQGFSGDGGAALSAALANPFSMAADAAGNVYVADRDNHRVRRIDTSGNITTVAGNGEQGFFGDGGPATSASLNTPTAVAVDTNGNIYIADSNNNRHSRGFKWQYQHIRRQRHCRVFGRWRSCYECVALHSARRGGGCEWRGLYRGYEQSRSAQSERWNNFNHRRERATTRILR